MAFCYKCGAPIEENASFCSKCGCAVNGSQQANTGYSNTTKSSFSDGINGVINDIENTDDHSAEYAPADIAANKGVSVLAYISILVLIPWLGYKYSPFARFHSNQGLVLFILGIICGIPCGIIQGITSAIHVAFIGSAITTIVSLCLLALAIMGIVYAAEGKAKELPLIGKIKILK